MHELINSLSLTVVFVAFPVSVLSRVVAVRLLVMRQAAAENPQDFFSKSSYRSIDELTDKAKLFFRIYQAFLRLALIFGLVGLLNSLV